MTLSDDELREWIAHLSGRRWPDNMIHTSAILPALTELLALRRVAEAARRHYKECPNQGNNLNELHLALAAMAAAEKERA